MLEEKRLESIELLEKEFWDSWEFDGDRWIVNRPEGTAEFKLGMVIREASKVEYEAMKAGFETREFSDPESRDTQISNSLEEKFYEKGKEYGEKFPKENFESAVAGRVPSPIDYWEMGCGIHYFGHGVNNQGEFDPEEAENVVNEGDFVEYYGDDFPEIDAFHPDSGLRYELIYYPVSLTE